jgi:hypothetical protein
MPQATLIIAAFFVLQSSGVSHNADRFPSLYWRGAPAGQSADDRTIDAVNRTRAVVDQVAAASYPELKTSVIQVKPFRSRSDYFKSRFGLPQYLFSGMRYLVYVNPRVFELRAPAAGVQAIIAHELAHVVYYKTRNRVRLLGLVRLSSKRFTAEFERLADLRAIALGYGEGLKEYRRWLYDNIPASKLAEKRRNYFSPDEIDAILSALRRRPELLEYWLKHVPLSLNQILNASPPSK